MNAGASPLIRGIHHRLNQHNLHIRCEELGQEQVDAVASLACQHHQSCHHIFIDVRPVQRPQPEVARRLQAAFRAAPIAAQKIVYKGKAGLELALDGNRVIVVDEAKAGHHCCGNFRGCACRKHKDSVAQTSLPPDSAQPVCS